MIALWCRHDTVSVVISAGDEAARPAEGLPAPKVPAVSDEPAHDHDIMHGTIPELAAEATWADRDVYISSPDHMIVKTAKVLRERGAPTRLIHYDLAP